MRVFLVTVLPTVPGWVADAKVILEFRRTVRYRTDEEAEREQTVERPGAGRDAAEEAEQACLETVVPREPVNSGDCVVHVLRIVGALD